MDDYIEQIVKRKPSSAQKTGLVFSYAAAALGIVSIMLVNFIIGVILVVIGGVLIYFVNRSMSSEYEYIFTNGDFDCAIIYDMSYRKEYLSFAEEHVVRILPYTGEKFQNEIQINKELDVKNLTSDDEENKSNWFAFIVKDKKGKQTAVVTELSEKCQEYIKKIYKNKIEI